MDNKQVILEHFKGNWGKFYGRFVDLPSTSHHNDRVKISSPFRDDNAPSFEITLSGPYEGFWHDWGTDERGHAFDFYARKHSLNVERNFPEVLKGIAETFSILLKGQGKEQTKVRRKGRRKKTPEEAVQSHRNDLEDSQVLNDLKQRRGLSDTTMEQFKIGRWQNSIVYPIWDEGGGIMGHIVHKGPHLKPDGTKAGSGEGVKAQLYPVSHLDADHLVVAEGPIDVWRLHTEGIPAITGTAGAGTWREAWTKALKGKDLIVVYDNDAPGREAQRKLVKALKGFARRLRCVDWPDGLPEGFDVTDWLHSGRAFSKLPLVEVEVQRVLLADVKATFRRWLHFDAGEDILLDVVLGAVVANRFSGDPVWLFVVAPPGGSKTETLRTLSEWREIYTLSSLTPSTLISGFVPKDGEDPSLLPKLNGKVCVVKDFTAILDMHREARQQILGDLRDAYDGEMSKAFGSGAGTRAYKSKFGLVAAVTPAIDRYSSISQQLGERFLKLRLTESGARNRVKQAIANSGREVPMRQELAEVMEGALLTCDVQDENAIYIREDLQDRLIDLADVLAVLRSDVSRDGYTRTIDYVPVPEIGTRLVKQFSKLARGIAAIRGKLEVGEDEFRLTCRIAKDTLSSKRCLLIHTVYRLYPEGFLSTQGIADEMDMPTETVKYALEDLRLLKIVDRQGRGKFTWRMSPEFSESLAALDFFRSVKGISGGETSEGNGDTPKDAKIVSGGEAYEGNPQNERGSMEGMREGYTLPPQRFTPSNSVQSQFSGGETLGVDSEDEEEPDVIADLLEGEDKAQRQ